MKPSRSIIYYTDNRLDDKIADAVRVQLLSIGLPIVSASLQPLDFGMNIHIAMERGYHAYFTQIVAALEASTSDVVYFCEHDVLYPKEHFDFTPPTKDKFYYNGNWWKTRSDGFAVTWNAIQVSGLVSYRNLALKYYASRLATFDPENFDRKFEPTVDDKYEVWNSAVPLVDIRHQGNLTYNKWHIQHFRNKATAEGLRESTIDKIPGWNLTAKDIYGYEST